MLLALTQTTFAQQKLGVFDNHEDIGNPSVKGSATYNPTTQEYTMASQSVNVWAKTDQFHFLWKKIKGDFIISASLLLYCSEVRSTPCTQASA